MCWPRPPNANPRHVRKVKQRRGIWRRGQLVRTPAKCVVQEPAVQEVIRRALRTCTKRQASGASLSSECTTPVPADMYCTAPRASASLLPSESWCVKRPSTTYVKISASRCGCLLRRGSSATQHKTYLTYIIQQVSRKAPERGKTKAQDWYGAAVATPPALR